MGRYTAVPFPRLEMNAAKKNKRILASERFEEGEPSPFAVLGRIEVRREKLVALKRINVFFVVNCERSNAKDKRAQI